MCRTGRFYQRPNTRRELRLHLLCFWTLNRDLVHRTARTFHHSHSAPTRDGEGFQPSKLRHFRSIVLRPDQIESPSEKLVGSAKIS